LQQDSFKDYVLDQLSALGITARRMFGGHGLYRGDEFFGILHRDRLYFRTDEHSRADYHARGMEPFRPNPKQTLVSYYEVPADVLDDSELLTNWARAALGTARSKRPRKHHK